MIVDNTYNQIKITIKVPPKGRFEVSNIQVYNYLLGNIYEYNSRKLLSKTYNKHTIVTNSYYDDEKVLISNISSNSNSSITN